MGNVDIKITVIPKRKNLGRQSFLRRWYDVSNPTFPVSIGHSYEKKRILGGRQQLELMFFYILVATFAGVPKAAAEQTPEECP